MGEEMTVVVTDRVIVVQLAPGTQRPPANSAPKGIMIRTMTETISKTTIKVISRKTKRTMTLEQILGAAAVGSRTTTTTAGGMTVGSKRLNLAGRTPAGKTPAVGMIHGGADAR